jgi:transketolase
MNYEDTLEEIVLSDDRYLVVTAENRAAIRSLPPELGERFIDVGISEQAMTGAAAGFALRGRVPVVHGLATFLTMRAFEFIRTDVGLPKLPVKLVGGVPGFLSLANGPTHQALEDVALMRGIPNMQVFCPADEQDLVIGLPLFLDSPHPVYIRHNPLSPVIEHEPDFEIGKAEMVSDGADLAILVYGTLFRQAYEARNLLQMEGRSVRLLNLRSLKPIDTEAILSAARQTHLLVTLEDHFLTGGLYSIVSEILLRNQVGVEVLPLALEERWFRPALLEDVLQHEGFTGVQIAERISARLSGIGRNGWWPGHPAYAN